MISSKMIEKITQQLFGVWEQNMERREWRVEEKNGEWSRRCTEKL